MARARDGQKQEAGGEGGALTSLVFSHSFASALKSSAETADTPRFTRQRRSGRQRMTTSTAAGVGKERERERERERESFCVGKRLRCNLCLERMTCRTCGRRWSRHASSVTDVKGSAEIKLKGSPETRLTCSLTGPSSVAMKNLERVLVSRGFTHANLVLLREQSIWSKTKLCFGKYEKSAWGVWSHWSIEAACTHLTLLLESRHSGSSVGSSCC